MKRPLLFLFILLAACKKETVLFPTKPLLSFPANNEICTTGTIISPTKTSIPFRWSASENTDNYTITIKNLESGVLSTLSTDQTNISVQLDRNAPYSWFILSKNTKFAKEEKSDTWKFYNPGPAITSYSPFPADLLSPKYQEVIPAATAKINLIWSCADPDGDLVNYDVYLGTAKVPPLYRAAVNTTSLTDLVLARSAVYYWKIVAIDAKGNKSNSDVYTFTLN